MKELVGWFFEECREKKTGIFHISALIFAVVFIGGCEQMRVDAQMEELCKKDGGIRVYEKVILPGDKFNENGGLIFFKTWNKSGDGYKFLRTHDSIKSDKPSIDKNTFTIIRESDNRVLGVFVTYLRTGGGVLPRLGPDPTRRCPMGIYDDHFLNSVFVKRKKVKINE